MSTPSCMWPTRNAAGRLCHTIGYWTPEFGHYLCPHHIGVARREGWPS